MVSPTGFETSGQKIWLDYITPFIDEYISDTYGTVVGVINPDAKYKVVIESVVNVLNLYEVESKLVSFAHSAAAVGARAQQP